MLLGVSVRPVLVLLHAVPLLALSMRGPGPTEGAPAESAADAKVVAPSMRPGARVVTSCSSQPLPSGSWNDLAGSAVGPAYSPVEFWNSLVATTPLPSSSARAA